MAFFTNLPENMLNELLDEIRLFYPDFALTQAPDIVHSFDGRVCLVSIDGRQYQFLYDAAGAARDDKRARKIFNKLAMYDALSDFTGRQMPWGSLTGIRPTKLAYDMIRGGAARGDIPQLLQSEFRVSAKKAAIIEQIIASQEGFLVDPNEYILLYVHIPFCKTICSYCAFTAEPIARSKTIIKDYCTALIQEIEHAKELASKMGRKVYSIYVGGGTPTAIPDSDLDNILAALGGNEVEFTVEAGRPDTITETKLAIMKARGVTRLCVNPQTLNPTTLTKIGRSHTPEQFFETYKSAREQGFVINVDLIAGLPGETFEDFAHSLEGVLILNPENITVHTLSIKNGAELKQTGYDHENRSQITKMTDYALTKLTQSNYAPYYLYRQKNMAENQENIGYAQENTQCAYNITSMEETLPVLASGSGAISKILGTQGKIDRLPNLRDPKLYLEKQKERLEKKESFFLK